MEEEGLGAPACWDRSQRALCSLGDGLVPRLGLRGLSAALCCPLSVCRGKSRIGAGMEREETGR